MSIRQRLTLWYTLASVLLLLALAVSVYLGGRVLLRQSADRDLVVRARLLADDLARNQEPVVLDTAYRVLALDGQVLRNSGLPIRRVPVTATALRVARNGQMYRESLAAPGLTLDGVDPSRVVAPNQIRLLTVPLGNPVQSILQVGEVARDERRFTSLLFLSLGAVLVIGLPLAGLGGWWLAGRALAPVRAMAESAQRIEDTNLAERLPQPVAHDELGQLASTFNQLLDRLQAAFQRERRFIADVSHDLRTPLALVKSTIGVALNRDRSAAELRSVLSEVDGQVDRVSSLLDATLFLSRADAEQLRTHYGLVDFSELLADLYETSAVYAEEEHGQILSCSVPPGLHIRGDRDQLTRLFLNLLDNAMQYTPRGGSIWLQGRALDGQVQVDVQDNGVGIAPADLPHIFDRFYRADGARVNPGGHHHGLGLSIAQAIAHAHGGTISAASSPGQGATFTVTLPLSVD
jgi:heavy metal sensor kinase